MTTSHTLDLQPLLDARRDELVAAALGRYENGTFTYATVGRPRLDAEGAVDVDTRFKWGSVTKLITAFLVCQLADEGRLRLDDPIDKHLPGFSARIGDNGTTTIRHLLAHQAGLVDLFERFDDAGQIIARLAAEGSIAAPGTLFSYTNAGYALLGALIQQVSGRSWRDSVLNRIIDPLDARTAVFVVAPDDANTASDYMFKDGVPTAAPLWPHTGPFLEAAGSSFASGIRDATHIISSVMCGHDSAKPGGPAWIGAAMLAEMHSVQARLPGPSVLAKSWGLGWSVDAEQGTVAHMGGTSAFALGIPGQRRLGIFLSNTPNGAEIGRTEFRRIFNLPQPVTVPTAHDTDMHTVVGRYTSPLFAFEVQAEHGRLFATSNLSPDRVELQPTGRRSYLARISSGREGIETEVNFLGDGSAPTHMHIALRALRRA
ncbi:serine hydrolase domain-containing protein [Peristeroidobacter soli]|uniref:serine hydrolase domain-containing protein n=1 Tax=Peristeroidobacter soli TaxID=2497877 RepID=UPI00101C8B33|nr:serine hydrolase domain-containing protein [Peristeroidobacter soli]